MGLNVTAKLGIAGTIGAILFAIGAVLFVVFPDIVNSKIKDNLQLVNGSDVYKSWAEAPVPIYMQFFFFNYTNPDEVVEGGKPILKQLGPYTFREFRKKVNISFNDEEDTVSYNQIKWFIFDASRSSGNLTDNVTTINTPFAGMAMKTEGKLSLVQQTVLPNVVRMFKQQPFMTKTVDELLYTGYKDKMMIFLAKQKGEEILPNGTFGYQYRMNYTADGTYTVFTGKKDRSKFLNVYKWNNETHVPWWATEYCNRINGSDGSTFKSSLSKDDTLYLYSTDLCRSIYLTYEKDESVHGLKVYRFSPPFSMLAGPDIEDNNKCFCPNETGCLKSGALDVGACKKGAPIVITLPHFLEGDIDYYEAVVGLDRKRELHSTVLDIEPKTGVVMRAHRRIQINVNLRPVSHIPAFKNITRMFYPILWVDENVEWPEARVEAFKSRVYKPMQIGNAVTYALLAIGGFIIAVVIIFTIHVVLKKSRTGHLQSSGMELKVPARQ